jgi:hypothetical protein
MTLRSIISRWKGRTRIFDTVPQPYTSHIGPLAHKVVVRFALAWLRCANEVNRAIVFGSPASNNDVIKVERGDSWPKARKDRTRALAQTSARNGACRAKGRVGRTRVGLAAGSFLAGGHAKPMFVGAECVGAAPCEYQRPARDGRTVARHDDEHLGRNRGTCPRE